MNQYVNYMIKNIKIFIIFTIRFEEKIIFQQKMID